MVDSDFDVALPHRGPIDRSDHDDDERDEECNGVRERLIAGRQSQQLAKLVHFTVRMDNGYDNRESLEDQVRRLVSANTSAYAELDRIKTKAKIESIVNQELLKLINEEKLRFDIESQLCRELSAELRHWQMEADKLQVARQVLTDRIRALKSSMPQKGMCPIPPLKPALGRGEVKPGRRPLTPTAFMRKMFTKPAMAQDVAGLQSSREVDYRPPTSLTDSVVKPDHMFDEFVVIASDLSCTASGLSDPSIQRWTSFPSVQFRYPAHHGSSLLEESQLVSFAFPLNRTDIVRSDCRASSSTISSLRLGQEQLKKGPNCHTFLHKRASEDPANTDVFGLCLRIFEVVTIMDPVKGGTVDLITEVAFCILSHYPFFSLHFDIIGRVLVARRLHNLQHPYVIMGPNLSQSAVGVFLSRRSGCLSILEDVRRASVPEAGARAKIACPFELALIEFRRSPSDDLDGIIDWCCSLPFSVSSGDTLIMLLDIVLREFTLIVVGDNLAMTSASVFTLHCMMQPLSWSGVFIPILPDNMTEFLQAPVPLIAGVAALPTHITSCDDLNDDIAVWFPESNEIWVPRRFHGRMPDADQLLDKVAPRLAMLQSTNKAIYSCNSGQQVAVADIVSIFRQYIERLIESFGRPDGEGDQMFLRAVRNTQMMSQYLSNNPNRNPPDN